MPVDVLDNAGWAGGLIGLLIALIGMWTARQGRHADASATARDDARDDFLAITAGLRIDLAAARSEVTTLRAEVQTLRATAETEIAGLAAYTREVVAELRANGLTVPPLPPPPPDLRRHLPV